MLEFPQNFWLGNGEKKSPVLNKAPAHFLSSRSTCSCYVSWHGMDCKLCSWLNLSHSIINYEEETTLRADVWTGEINLPSSFLDVSALAFNGPHDIPPFLGMMGLDLRNAAEEHSYLSNLSLRVCPEPADADGV